MKFNNKEIFIERLSGNGNFNFVLIHNAGGSYQFFKHQIKTLKKYGDVIYLNLPAHGDSQEITSYRMHDLSKIINHICQNLNLHNISLVGLNNGANIAIDTFLNFTLPIKNLILIDPPLFMDNKFIGEIEEFIYQLKNEDQIQFANRLTENLFIDTDLQNKEIAKNAFTQVNKNALIDIFKGLIEWDIQLIDKLKNIFTPTLCILTDEHHCRYDKLRQAAPQFEIGKVIGSKCWATLEVPEQVNAMIERFLILNK